MATFVKSQELLSGQALKRGSIVSEGWMGCAPASWRSPIFILTYIYPTLIMLWFMWVSAIRVMHNTCVLHGHALLYTCGLCLFLCGWNVQSHFETKTVSAPLSDINHFFHLISKCERRSYKHEFPKTARSFLNAITRYGVDVCAATAECQADSVLQNCSCHRIW